MLLFPHCTFSAVLIIFYFYNVVSNVSHWNFMTNNYATVKDKVIRAYTYILEYCYQYIASQYHSSFELMSSSPTVLILLVKQWISEIFISIWKSINVFSISNSNETSCVSPSKRSFRGSHLLSQRITVLRPSISWFYMKINFRLMTEDWFYDNQIKFCAGFRYSYVKP